jgi:hypothetical protein
LGTTQYGTSNARRDEQTEVLLFVFYEQKKPRNEHLIKAPNRVHP